MSGLNTRAKLGLISFFAILVALMMFVSLYSPTNHDEYQYIAAAYLSRDLSLYSDFFYGQTPYFPVVLGKLSAAFTTDGTGVFVVSRMFNLFWSVVFVGSLLFALLSISRSALVSVILCFFVLTSELMLFSLRTARNDMMPLALVTVALAVIQSISHHRKNRHILANGIVGALLSAAVCTKQSFIFVLVPFAIYALIPFRQKLNRQLRTVVIPMAVGGLLAAIPAIWMALRDLENFIYSNGEYHRTLHAIMFYGTEDPGLFRRLTRMMQVLTEPSLITLSIIGPVCILSRFPRSVAELLKNEFAPILTLAFLVCFFVSVSLFLANPLWPQYAAPLLPFLAALVASIYRISNLPPATDSNFWPVESARLFAP